MPSTGLGVWDTAQNKAGLGSTLLKERQVKQLQLGLRAGGAST